MGIPVYIRGIWKYGHSKFEHIVYSERRSAYTATSESQRGNEGEAMKLRKDSADKGAGSGCMARLVRCSSFYDLVLAEVEVLFCGYWLRHVWKAFSTGHILDRLTVNGSVSIGNGKTKIAGWALPHKDPPENRLIGCDIAILGHGFERLVCGLNYILGINAKEDVILAKKRLPDTHPFALRGLLLKRGRINHKGRAPKIREINHHSPLDMDQLWIAVDPYLCPALHVLSPRGTDSEMRDASFNALFRIGTSGSGSILGCLPSIPLRACNKDYDNDSNQAEKKNRCLRPRDVMIYHFL